jgi:hypothetical protein
MSGFVVDSRTLLAMRDTLGRLNDRLLGMHTVIWHQWGTLGGHTLESELEHFCGTWHYGVTELGGQLQDLTRRLGEAAAAYERIEERITNATGPRGTHYSGGAAVGPVPTGSGGTRGSGGKRPGHSGDTHSGGGKHSGVGSGTTVIGGGPAHDGGSHHSGSPHAGGSGSGTGTTVIGGGPTMTTRSGGGTGTTTIDEKIRHAEDRQRAELAAVLKIVES